MKFGIIYCAYGTPEYIQPSLENWIKLKKKYNIKIAAVNGMFKEMRELGYEDNDPYTESKLNLMFNDSRIDYLYIQNPSHLELEPKIYQTESEIRDKALQWLLKQDVDYVMLLDSDEFYTEQQIENIIEYISREDNKYFSWFSINFKNYIFDGKQWIDGFCPPRIFKINISNQLKLDSFFWDNDIIYKEKSGGTVDYRQLTNKSIPRTVAHIKHLTWLHSNGEKKVEYQNKHFKGICSYSFNKEKKELEFNKEYYKNIPYPTIIKD